jgi:hypothetical protein
VAANGKDIDMSIVKLIHKPVFLTKSPRPKARKVVSKCFWFPQAGTGVTLQYFFQNCAEIFVHPFIALP